MLPFMRSVSVSVRGKARNARSTTRLLCHGLAIHQTLKTNKFLPAKGPICNAEPLHDLSILLQLDFISFEFDGVNSASE